MISVVSAPSLQQGFVVRNLAGHITDIVIRADRVYVLCAVNRREADLTFTDPLDGMLLVECKYFDDEPSARQWITSDAALRAARPQGVQ